MKATLAATLFVTIGLSATVCAQAKSGNAQSSATSRRYINLPNRPVQAPFSDGVVVGQTLYIAGRIGVDPKTGKFKLSRKALLPKPEQSSAPQHRNNEH